MTTDAFADYLKHRYHDRVRWYDKHATRMMYMYRIFKGYTLVAAAAIPALVAIGASAVVAASVAASIAAAGSIEGLFKYHEMWLTYRRANEFLQREFYMYETRSDVYSRSAHPEQAFVSRIESIISQEGSNWLAALERDQSEPPEAAAIAARPPVAGVAEARVPAPPPPAANSGPPAPPAA